ncbi:GroES-like protein [Caulochytrium protostelioides]|uniref:GroES-like protein n=2 Tax=Caulochytrium protostelioides TaxID=1555241 RepID=A0A4P9WZ79_9FUNG|nr:GroES-like protein [Caulochytrium protostelioides]
MNAAANMAQKAMGDEPVTLTKEKDIKTRPGLTQRACVWRGKEKVEVIDAQVPDVTDPQDAIVRITGSTLCGSDSHIFKGEIPQMTSGDILGHEACGIVESVGPDVRSDLKPGQRVVVSFSIACGTCRYCKEGLTTHCNNTNPSTVQGELYGSHTSAIFGYSGFVGPFSGGQAEWIRVPFANTNLLPVPDDVPDEKALYLSDIVCTSYHAVIDTGCQAGETVGVWGAGPIGLMACQWLKNVIKVDRLICVDGEPDRLALAAKLGAETINYKDHKDIVAYVREQVPNGLDRAIDCTGGRFAMGMLHKIERAVGLETDTPEIVEIEMKCLRKMGTLGLIQDMAAYSNHFPIGLVMMKAIRLIGCGQAPVQKYWKKLLEYIRDGTVDPTLILTHRITLEDLPKAYAAFTNHKMHFLKCFIETKFSQPRAAGTPELYKGNWDTA